MSVRLTLAAAVFGLLATAPAEASWWRPNPRPPHTGGSSGGSSGGTATPVPAPAGIGLFALGVAGIAIGRRSRRRG